MKSKGFLLMPGTIKYDEGLDLQKKINAARRRDIIPDTVIFLEHYPCLTLGRNSNHDNILANARQLENQGVTIYKTDRGGDVTYHGPGQIVCYPILDISSMKMDIYEYARSLELMIIKTLETFGIESMRKKGYPGVWTSEQDKIAFEGITVDRGITMHGVSLNVEPNLDHFDLIVPCGLKSFTVTSMKKCLGHDVEIQEVVLEMCAQISDVFNIELKSSDLKYILEIFDSEKTKPGLVENPRTIRKHA